MRGHRAGIDPFRIMWVAAGLTLGGCATVPGSPGGDGAPRTITLEAGPCFGACPSYRIVARSDGTGRFVGQRFTAVTGEREVRLAPGGFERLEAELAPYKPAPGEMKRIVPGENCERQATDMPAYELDWSDGARVSYYSGCMDARHQGLRAAVRGAPQVLGIQELLKRP